MTLHDIKDVAMSDSLLDDVVVVGQCHSDEFDAELRHWDMKFWFGNG